MQFMKDKQNMWIFLSNKMPDRKMDDQTDKAWMAQFDLLICVPEVTDSNPILNKSFFALIKFSKAKFEQIAIRTI